MILNIFKDSFLKYPLTFYVKSLPSGFQGCANGPVIRILKSCEKDTGLYYHELCHVKQWFMTLGLHSILYLLFDKYKLWSEVQAYKEQNKHYPDDRSPLFAYFISKNYGLSITQEEALTLLRKN